MPKLAICNLCGHNNYDIIVEQPKRKIIRCRNCGLVFVGLQPSIEEIQLIYTKDYYRSDSSLGYKDYTEIQDVLVETAKLRLRELEKFCSSGKLLDIGCATGEFLEVADHRGWLVQGIEISTYAANIAKDKGIPVFAGVLEEAKFPFGSFDVVTMWDLIEHIKDPLNHLREIKRILKPNGFIGISTPNFESLRARIEGRNWWGFKESQEHLYFFSPKTLRNMLEKTGFEIVYNRTEWIDLPLRYAIFPRLNPKQIPFVASENRSRSICKIMNTVLERKGYGHVLVVIAKKGLET